jgi:hypothetical protein
MIYSMFTLQTAIMTVFARLSVLTVVYRSLILISAVSVQAQNDYSQHVNVL